LLLATDRRTTKLALAITWTHLDNARAITGRPVAYVTGALVSVGGSLQIDNSG
jgi:hypothetical protein